MCIKAESSSANVLEKPSPENVQNTSKHIKLKRRKQFDEFTINVLAGSEVDKPLLSLERFFTGSSLELFLSSLYTGFSPLKFLH